MDQGGLLMKAHEYCMQHWNGNQLCAIDVETSGLNPLIHEVVQICILPLNNLIEPRRDVLPFYMNLRPENPECLDEDALKTNKLTKVELMEKGYDRYKAAGLFEEWIMKLKLPVTDYGTPKKIYPLGHNYAFDRVFIMKWLGEDLYNYYFHYHYRDTMQSALYLNDRAGATYERIPYPKVNLEYLCNIFKIEHTKKHDALGDCIATAEIYKKMLTSGTLV